MSRQCYGDNERRSDLTAPSHAEKAIEYAKIKGKKDLVKILNTKYSKILKWKYWYKCTNLMAEIFSEKIKQ